MKCAISRHAARPFDLSNVFMKHILKQPQPTRVPYTPLKHRCIFKKILLQKNYYKKIIETLKNEY